MKRWLLILLLLPIPGCQGAGSSSSRPSPPPVPPSPPPVVCSYAPEAIAAFDAAGGSTSLTVATAPGCGWTLTSSDTWIAIVSRGPFSGPTSVGIGIDPNRSFSSRTGTVVVTGQARETLAAYPIVQRGAGCLYSTDPTQATLTWIGTYDGAGDSPLLVRVHAAPADCRWTATPSVPWIRIVYGTASGSGDSTIYVSLVQWNTGPARNGEVVVSGLSGVNPDAHLAVTQGAR